MLNEKKNSGISLGRRLLAVSMLLLIITGTGQAKSLYVIAGQQSPTPIQSFDIQADRTLAYQSTVGVASISWGPVGLTIDTDSAYLFVTYESENYIELVDAETLTSLGTTTAPGASNLAGIVVDQEKQKIYTVDRHTNDLFVYSWDASTKTLTLDNQYNLSGAAVTAFGIALDEINDILYVSANTTTVYYYSTNDFTTLAGTVTLTRNAIGIAIDVKNGLLYTGGAWGGNRYLTQTNLATNATQEVLVGTTSGDGVMGIAVDPSTGYVYCTTGFYNDAVVAFNPADLSEIDRHGINDHVPGTPYYGPTGICIPGKDISVNPLNLSKNDGIEEYDDPNCVPAGGTITYDICYDNNNVFDATNVTIVDTLPVEVDFISASDGGVYNPGTHTVTWTIGTLPAGTPTDCVQLVVQIKPGTPVGSVIDNSCQISAAEPGTGPTTRHEFTTVCLNQPPDVSGAYPSIGTVSTAPSHKWVDIYILGVTDPDGDPVTIIITGITQDEPTIGPGSGSTCPDGMGVGSSFASVRAERKGGGDGRIYEISFDADDGYGGVASGDVTVCVPHSKGNLNSCVDSGQIYDSTVCN